MNINLLSPIIMLCMSGCIVVDCGYTNNEDVINHRSNQILQYPITFSVALSFDDYTVSNITGGPSHKGMSYKIEKALEQTGLFSDIQYAPEIPKYGYHVDFKFYVSSNMTKEQSYAQGLLMGYTLFAIPLVQEYGLDCDAIVYLNGEPVLSYGAAELGRCVIWLPFAPIGLYANCWYTGHLIEKGIVNKIANEFAKEHIKTYIHATQKTY